MAKWKKRETKGRWDWWNKKVRGRLDVQQSVTVSRNEPFKDWKVEVETKKCHFFDLAKTRKEAQKLARKVMRRC